VDVRKGVELEAENSLKFWEWSDVQSKYRLSAQVTCEPVCAAPSCEVLLTMHLVNAPIWAGGPYELTCYL
jgi:hypothetical protein